MSTNRWLNWTPKEPILGELAQSEPSKPTKPGFDGFEGTASGEAAENAPLEEILKGHALEFYLADGELLFIVADEEDAAKLWEPRGTIYTAAEVRHIIQVTDPSTVAEVHRWKRELNATVLDFETPSDRRRPRGADQQSLRVLKTVDTWYDGRKVPMAIARHGLAGNNRFGEDGGQAPYCVINTALWRRDCPADLRLIHWYRSIDEAVACAQGRGVLEPPKGPETQEQATPQEQTEPPEKSGQDRAVERWRAHFAGGIEVELEREAQDRWVMSVNQDGRWKRRKDFASPFLEHSRLTAEHWYGTLLAPWFQTGKSGSKRKKETK